jgi:GINS complex subunit 2
MPSNLHDSFFCKDIPVVIIPKINLKRLDLIEGSFGPFFVGRQIEIPIWLSELLYKSGKCTILPPEFLTCTFLEEVLQEERASESSLSQRLPRYFFELCKLFLDVLLNAVAVAASASAATLERPQQVRILVQNLADLRLKKIHTAVLKDLAKGSALQLDGITQSEVSMMRLFLSKSAQSVEFLRKQHESVVVRDETSNSLKYSFGSPSSSGVFQ